MLEQPEHWVEPEAGFQYLPDTISVVPTHQAEKLAACGIDAGVFGEQVDPAFFIGIAIHAGIRSGISAEGNINMLQGLQMHRPPLLDEPLNVRGEILEVTSVPRGRRVHTDVWFEDAQGQRVISAVRTSLKPDLSVADKGGAGERPQPVVADPAELQLLNKYTLTPERVKAYSMEGNSIHYEQEAAEQAGFRAPLIGGGMGVHYLTAELWRYYRPKAFSADIYFRRPIFWDESVQVGFKASVGTHWDAMAVLKQGGAVKVGTEIALRDLVPS
tara:strand:- start:247 stop:1062 length:816 start_codon:yes stop_codon:yes gene_type:complete